jgi:hypothetical protein
MELLFPGMKSFVCAKLADKLFAIYFIRFRFGWRKKAHGVVV